MKLSHEGVGDRGDLHPYINDNLNELHLLSEQKAR
jgi:hypothetical protein